MSKQGKFSEAAIYECVNHYSDGRSESKFFFESVEDAKAYFGHVVTWSPIPAVGNHFGSTICGWLSALGVVRVELIDRKSVV